MGGEGGCLVAWVMVSVLVVDDDKHLCHAIADGLAEAGYDTREAHDGNQPVKMFGEQPSDIVVTDLFMPDCDGFEVIMHLRREAPNVRIIAMSGADDTTAGFLRAASQFGAEYILRKPFRIKALPDTVAACAAALTE